MVVSTIILIIVIIFIPPVGVLLMDGCGANFLINICLTILGYLPGHFHAFWLLYKRETAKGGGGNATQGSYAQTPAQVQPQGQYQQPVYKDAQNTGVVQPAAYTGAQVPGSGYQATGYVKQ